MFKFTLIGVLLLVAIATINCVFTTETTFRNNMDSELRLDIMYMNPHREFEIIVQSFRLENGKENSTFRFAMIKSMSPVHIFAKYCLDKTFFEDTNKAVAFLTMDFVNNQVQIKMSKQWTNFMIFEDRETAKAFNGTKTTVEPLRMDKNIDQSNKNYSYYSFKYYIVNDSEDLGGIYDLRFLNCDQVENSFEIKLTS